MSLSVINRMLEKSTQRRFSGWSEIIQLLDKQSESDSPIDKMVAMAVAAKNAEDIDRQNQESARKKLGKGKSDFCALVFSQFENTIIAPIENFVEKINTQYAGNSKIRLPQKKHTQNSEVYFSWKMIIPDNNSLTINMEAVLKENHKHVVVMDRTWSNNNTRTEFYTPQYKKKNILAWCEVTNKLGYGFNLLLLDSGEIYGDWIIMMNNNNMSLMTGKDRKLPFAFQLSELPSEINNVQTTHLYSSDFNPFSEESFLSLINLLAFELR